MYKYEYIIIFSILGSACSDCPGNTVCSKEYPGLCGKLKYKNLKEFFFCIFFVILKY